jgi:hypothetical protein
MKTFPWGDMRKLLGRSTGLRLAGLSLLLILPALVVVLSPGTGDAGACTKGVDCYCDKVAPGGPLADPSLLFCEDFEAPTLRNNQGVGNGPPYYGPWYDSTGMNGDRGHNSYWNMKYGNGVSSFLFTSGQPSAPALGSPCGFSLCTGARVWDAANRWSANAYSPQLAIFASPSDFSAEISSIRPPTNTARGGTPGVFDGNASLGYRIQAGATHGIAGQASFPTSTEIGYTTAMAYPNNSLASGVWGTTSMPGAWKHNEWLTVTSPNCGFDGLFAFYNQSGPRSGRPFAGFIGAFGSNCTGGGYTGSITSVAAGAAQLINGGLGIAWNTPTNYNQPTDWPEGTWGCVRGHISGVGTSAMRHRVWFQGPNMTSERLLIDFTANGTGLDNRQGYNGMKWNAYANTNQGQGYTATTQLTFRYEDNVHVRRGLPVSCSQIGFGGSSSADTMPPAGVAAPTVR